MIPRALLLLLLIIFQTWFTIKIIIKQAENIKIKTLGAQRKSTSKLLFLYDGIKQYS